MKFDVQMISEGPLQGHGISVDALSLEQILFFLQARGGEPLPSRMGHRDEPGWYLGDITDFRLEDRAVRGQLELSTVSQTSPFGDLYTYMSTMLRTSFGGFSLLLVVDDEEGAELRLDWGPDDMNPVICCDYVDFPASGVIGSPPRPLHWLEPAARSQFESAAS